MHKYKNVIIVCKNHWKGAVIGCFMVIMNLFFCTNIYASELKTYEFEGNGTQYDPYLITSYEDICALRDIVDAGNMMNGIYFRQTVNIEFPENEVWNPIGELSPALAFAGYYDGRGHTISNINCQDTYAGLFSFLAGSVRNLGIESGTIKGSYVGSITSHGTDSAQIVNCYNKANVIADGRAGGIADNCPGMILFCINMGNIQGASESVPTAGISSYGNPYIAYCYDAGNGKLVNDSTFWGSIIESDVFSLENAEMVMQRMHDQMWKVYSSEGVLQEIDKKVSIKRGDITFMRKMDGTIAFDSEYEPELFREEKKKNEKEFLNIYKTRFDFVGTGTREDPFQITDYADLVKLRDCVDVGVTYRGIYFVQTVDIVFPDGINWNPVGNVSSNLAFCGYYDGNGYTISDICCEDSYAGLFSLLNGEVCNLGIESGIFKGDFIGSITSHGGGEGRITNCYNKADVIGNYRAGGIADNFGGGVISFCWNLGNVSGTQENTQIAGISSYTVRSVEYCHSISGNDVICPLTFTGKQVGSSVIKEEMIADTMGNDYRNYVQYISDKIIDSDQIVFPIVEGTSLKYDRTFIPDQIKKAVVGKMLPVYVLMCIAILFGAAALVGSRNGKILENETGGYNYGA